MAFTDLENGAPIGVRGPRDISWTELERKADLDDGRDKMTGGMSPKARQINPTCPGRVAGAQQGPTCSKAPRKRVYTKRCLCRVH